MHGGGQEQRLRSATEFVAGLVGLGRAAEIAGSEMSAEAVHLVALRDRLIETIATHIPGAYLIGHRHRRLPGHLCLGFAGQEGEAIKLLLALDELGFAVSSGSACSAPHASEPSYVMLAMGFDALQGARFSASHTEPFQHSGRGRSVSGSLAATGQVSTSCFHASAGSSSLVEFDAYFQVLAKGHRVMINQDEARGTRIRVDLPGLNCGFCGYRRCEEMAAHLDTNPDLLERCIHLAPERVSTQTAVVDHPRLNSACASCTTADRGNPAQTRTAWKDSLGREFDFYLEHFPEDPGPREIIIPHNPMLITRRWTSG